MAFWKLSAQDVVYFSDSTVTKAPSNLISIEYRHDNSLMALKKIYPDSSKETLVVYYSSGKIKFHSTFTKDNGLRIIKGYDSKGHQFFSVTYLDDTLHGVYIEYYPGGTVKKEIRFVNGIIEGKAMAYEKNGKLLAEGDFQNGLRHGSYRFYSQKGAYIIEKYIRGKINSSRLTYNYKGEITSECYPDSSNTYYMKTENKKNGKVIFLTPTLGKSIYGNFLGLPFPKNQMPFYLEPKQ